MAEKVYWMGSLGDKDDFGLPYKGVMYDAKTKNGQWANMSYDSWVAHGAHGERLGTGYGQKYRQQDDGRWLKVEG